MSACRSSDLRDAGVWNVVRWLASREGTPVQKGCGGAASGVRASIGCGAAAGAHVACTMHHGKSREHEPMFFVYCLSRSRADSGV